jgi:hypothetical protein
MIHADGPGGTGLITVVIRQLHSRPGWPTLSDSRTSSVPGVRIFPPPIAIPVNALGAGGKRGSQSA